MAQNPNCDGAFCILETGEVRLYPLGGGGNLILCRACFAHENTYRMQRARETRAPENWPLINWRTATPYPEETS